MNKQPSRGQLVIVSAPSGAGKTSLIKALIESDDRIEVSVSHTTRAMRPGEKNGENYFFVSSAEFDTLRNDGAFFEWAEVFGHFYGTSVAQLESRLSAGADVIVEIDWQGAQQIRQLMPESAWIFILPPSVEALKARLENRGQDDPGTIDVRMRAARDEISHWEEADYLIVNEDFDTALSQLKAVIKAQRLRTNQQRSALNALLCDLLGSAPRIED